MRFRSTVWLCVIAALAGGLCRLALAGVPGPPALTSINPPPGTISGLTQVTVTFNEAVTGLDLGDLRMNDLLATNLVANTNTFTYTFQYRSQPPYGPVTMSWVAGHDIKDTDTPTNDFPGAPWSYDLVDTDAPIVTNRFPAAGSTQRNLGEIEVLFSEAVEGVDAADLLINSQPATNVIPHAGGLYVFEFPSPPAGAVQVAWAAGHGIRDVAATPNAFAGGAWSYLVDPNWRPGDLVITELCAANRNGLLDEESEAQDWIEIQNRGTNPVALAGWSLSDDPNTPGQWVFNAGTLLPRQFLVVFASGKDRKLFGGTNRLHTGFTLNANGEFLGLHTPDSPRLLAGGFTPKFPEQRTDHSYGLDTSNQWRYFAAPTPGASNGMSTITGIAQPVHFSAARGHYTQPFDLVLTTPTRGATILYTTNGTEPGWTNGFPYTSPLRVAGTAILRAAAFRTNLLPSLPTTHTYLFNQSAALRSLPVLSIVTAQNNLTGPTGVIGIGGGSYVNGIWTATAPGDYNNCVKFGIAWERPVSAEFIRPEDNSGFQIDCGIRIHGSAYMRPRYTVNSKFSYRLYFRGDYGAQKLDYPLMPGSSVESFDQLVLRAGHNDISNPFIKDELVRRLHADMGHAACAGTFVNLFVNGVSKGYYNPSERVEETFLQSRHGGGEDWDRITVSSTVQSGDNIAWSELRNIFLTRQDVRLPSVYADVARRLDLTNFADYLLVEVYPANWDWPHNNWRAARERVPGYAFRYYVWDAEGSFDFNMRQPNFDVFTATNRGLATSAEISTFYQTLRTNSEFRLLFADRVQKHMFNNGALTDANVTNRFNELRAVMAGVIPSMNLAAITNWVPNRRAPLFAQFNAYGLYVSNAPVFSQHGGRVPRNYALTMSAPHGGTIYFSTNGGDPRVPFSGAVATNVLRYTNGVPLRLAASTVVRARTLNGTNWSALSEAAFQVESLGVPLRISEIHYNPPGGAAYEFIELLNVGSGPVDLGSLSFDGVNYTFPEGAVLAAGATLILASDLNPAAFVAAHPGVTVFGWFDANLNNAGDRLVLKDAAGNVIVSVDFDDAGGWPTAPDGTGPSLEIIDPLGDPDDPANWRASAQAGGTPGTITPPPAPPLVRLNEIMADNVLAVSNAGTFPDWIELHNAGPSAVDLGDWSFTDDGNPRKFVFPSNTFLPAGGYLVVWCDDLTNTTPGLHTGFALSRSGESLFLYDPAGTRVDAVSFGLQLADFSVGRIGDEWQLTQPTTNAVNIAAALASVTNLAINEWLANPAAGQGDWLELVNRSTSLPVPLRGLYVATSNKVQQITSLSFLGPLGFARLFADDRVGPDHLDLTLPASGGAIVLSDELATEFERVTYTVQAEGVSRGRLPDGSANFTNFVGTASPGASNHVNAYAGPVLNEVLARNQTAITNNGRVADFVEIFNPSAAAFDLSGMSLSLDEPDAGQWSFPPGTVMPSNGFLVVWCDGDRAASFAPGDFNTGRSLDGESGGAWLFNAAGQLMNSVQYGFQVADQSIGLSGGQWRLLSAPTPGASNAAPTTLGTSAALRLNEWMANPLRGADWFELFNATNWPVELSGLFLTDDPSAAGATNFAIPPLTFIGPGNWVKFVADSDPEQGRDHVNFSLDADGETLRLYTVGGALLDSVVFGRQKSGVSQGRLPDGSASVVDFAGSASPGEANFRLLPGIVINEILTHAPAPLEQAAEIFNTGLLPADVSGWFLSDSPANFRKFRLPEGSLVPAGGFLVVSQSQFGVRFTLDAARGGELWLSASDVSGNLTGERTVARFGAAEAGVTFGRYTTSADTDYVALSGRTFGGENAAPLVGPIVVNEIMYHPPDGTNAVIEGEYIELLNITGTNVPLHDPAHPTNAWRLRGGVSFDFPPGATLDAGGFLLIVDFDPANPLLLAAFRSQYGVAESVPVFGPWNGKLDNAGETVSLLKPDVPSGGLVPNVLVEKLDYAPVPPWPAGAVDGGGLSLQRRDAAQFGNEPLNWTASLPTPGATNGAGVTALPLITAHPQDVADREGSDPQFTVAASGASLSYQWRFEGVNIPDATNAIFIRDFALLEDEGAYDALVSNPAGSVLSGSARLRIINPPLILAGPPDLLVWPGTNVALVVSAIGSMPLFYQWRKDGADLPGANLPTLPRANVQTDDAGVYEVVITNADGCASAAATLTVLTHPLITQQPQPDVWVWPGSNATLSVTAESVTPLTFQWRRNGTNLFGATNATLFITSMSAAQEGAYAVEVTDTFGSVLSEPAEVRQLVKPTITQHPWPSNVVALVGGDASFIGAAFGFRPFGFNWRKDSTQITNIVTAGTNCVFTLGNAQLTNAGRYRFSVTNAAGSTAFSQYGYLTVMEPMTNVAAWPGSNAAFRLVASTYAPGAAPSDLVLFHRWYFNETNLIAGATTSNLTLNGVQLTNEGTYRVVATNSRGAVASQTVSLIILRPPVITRQPTNQEVVIGSNGVFIVQADGSAPLGFQWWFNQTNLLADGTNTTLVIANAQLDNAGTYHIVVTNTVGAVTSQIAMLTVTNGDSDGDGLPDWWEQAHGLDPRSNADAALDSDNDGLTNLEEFIAGTHPRDAASVLKVERVVMPGDSNEVVTVSFPGVAGRSYSVQHRSGWPGSVWEPLTNVPALDTNQPVTVRDPGAAGEAGRFYRLLTPAQP